MKNKFRLSSLFGMLTGFLSIILSFVMYGTYAGSHESYLSYGGDAYTGIQNAGACAANNVKALTEAFCFGMGSLLLVIGLALVFYNAGSVIKHSAEEETVAPEEPVKEQAEQSDTVYIH
ncbi:MAG: hypothetical protein IJA60_02065 [Clostridia bacterium]|nr:hypothetical protein [Clostridia bacterium]